VTIEQDSIRVVLATDSFLLGDGLAAIISGIPDISVVGRARAHEDLGELVETLVPDAVIYGIRTSVITTKATVAFARHLRDRHPDMAFVVISDKANGFALEMLRGGASRIAYLLDEHLPSVDTLVTSLRAVREGETVLDPTIVDSLVGQGSGALLASLTPRDSEVLEQMAYGLSNTAIAAELNISVKAVEKGITAIFAKLGPFEPGMVDRRVSASLAYLRAQADPFGRTPPGDGPGNAPQAAQPV
jgi:DNA-binding NarL/FixJ family response regulator